jgi:ATP-dependent DNA helicase RecG
MKDLRRGRAVSRQYRNRRIGDFLKELDLAEGRSTGIPKIFHVMQENGSPPPEFETDDDRTSFLIRLPVHPAMLPKLAGETTPHDTPHVSPHVSPQVERLLAACEGELLREELQERLGLKDRKHFREALLHPAIDAGLLEMTIPEKPKSRNQRYRLTDMGRELRENMAGHA